jgi:hypothetical protein
MTQSGTRATRRSQPSPQTSLQPATDPANRMTDETERARQAANLPENPAERDRNQRRGVDEDQSAQNTETVPPRHNIRRARTRPERTPRTNRPADRHSSRAATPFSGRRRLSRRRSPFALAVRRCYSSVERNASARSSRWSAWTAASSVSVASSSPISVLSACGRAGKISSSLRCVTTCSRV